MACDGDFREVNLRIYLYSVLQYFQPEVIHMNNYGLTVNFLGTIEAISLFPAKRSHLLGTIAVYIHALDITHPITRKSRHTTQLFGHALTR